MAKRRPLPDAVWEVIEEKIDILIAQDYRVHRFTRYHYRIADRLDIYPRNKRWHEILTMRRGTYSDLINFVQDHL